MAGGLNTSSRRRNGRRRTFEAKTDINITPLVDVMLVLLVIFMITAPIMTVGVPVDLPKTEAAKMNDSEEPIVVSVDGNGKIFLQETELTLPVIVEKLKALTNNTPDAKIYVRGDKKLSYGQIMEIMGGIAAAGFTRVSLIAELPAAVPAKSSIKTKGP